MPLHLPSEGAALPRRSLEKALWHGFLTSEKDAAGAASASSNAAASRASAACARPVALPPRPPPAGAAFWRRTASLADELHRDYLSPRRPSAKRLDHARSGYQFYFLPRNLLRSWHVWQQLPWQARSPQETQSPQAHPLALCRKRWGNTWHVLDLGCGPGTFSLMLLCWLAHEAQKHPTSPLPRLAITLLDRSAAMLNLARHNLIALHQELALPADQLQLHPVRAEGNAFLQQATPKPEAPYQLLGGLFVLNELQQKPPHHVSNSRASTSHARLHAPAPALLAPHALQFWLEPGTQQGYRNLMQLRRTLDASSQILYPCPHRQACPLERRRAWCHADLPALPSIPFAANLAHHFRRKQRHGEDRRRVHLDGEEHTAASQAAPLHLAALVLQQGKAIVTPFETPHGARVISASLPARRSEDKRSAKRRKKPASASRPAAVHPSSARVQLLCTPAGTLHERSMPYHPRGSLVPLPSEEEPT